MSALLKDKTYSTYHILYGSVIVVMLGCMAFLQWLTQMYVDNSYYLAFCLSLVLGVVHVHILKSRFGINEQIHLLKGFIITALLLIFSMTIIAVIYYLLKLNFNFLTFMAGFLIPYLTYWGYVNYLQIPEDEFKLSSYPFDTIFPDISEIDFSETIVINFVLSKGPDSRKKTSFTTRAPQNMPVSELFFTFINEYNRLNPVSIIHITNKHGEPYSWLFYIKKGLLQQKEFMNPDLSFRENAVAPDQHIYAVRKLQDAFN